MGRGMLIAFTQMEVFPIETGPNRSETKPMLNRGARHCYGSGMVYDVFVETWHHAQQLDHRRGTIRGWAMTRPRRRALYREFEGRHDAGVLRNLFIELPEDLAEVLEGAYYDGMSAAALADRLGIPVGTMAANVVAANGTSGGDA